MSKTDVRTLEEIQTEYAQLCTQAGHLQYQILASSENLKTLNDKIRMLNFEAAQVSEAAKEKKENE